MLERTKIDAFATISSLTHDSSNFKVSKIISVVSTVT
jgi:hypothetical protein